MFSPMNRVQKHINPPKQSDSKGTAFRIRPQTPKLNLLELKTKKRPHHLEALPINIKTKANLLEFGTDLAQRDEIETPAVIEKPKKKKKRVKKPFREEEQPNIPALTKDDIEIRDDLSDNDRVFSDDQAKPNFKGPSYDSDEGPNL